MKNTLKKFFKLWTEIWSIPLGLLLFWYSPHIIRFVDPTAGVFDLGILHKLLYAVVAILLGNGIAFLGIKFNFPSVFEFYKSESEPSAFDDFKSITPWQRLKLLAFLYALILFCFALLAQAG
jgi:hypothetical protein